MGLLRQLLFRAYFNRLHDFCASLMTKDADQTAAAIAKAGSSVATYDVTISTHTHARTHHVLTLNTVPNAFTLSDFKPLANH